MSFVINNIQLQPAQISFYQGKQVVRTPLEDCCDIVARKALLAIAVIFSCGLALLSSKIQKIRDEVKEGNKITFLTKAQIEAQKQVNKRDQLPNSIKKVPKMPIKPGLNVPVLGLPEVKAVVPNATEVRTTAEIFIKNLSDDIQPPRLNDRNMDKLLTAEERIRFDQVLNHQIKQKYFKPGTQPEEMNLTDEEKKFFAKFHRVAEEKTQNLNSQIWEHEDFPKIIFRPYLDKEDSENRYRVREHLQDIVQNMNGSWIQLPQVLVRDEPGLLYVEERLSLFFDYDERNEFWARILSHYQSPQANENFKANFKKLMMQFKDLIVEQGYGDVHIDYPRIRKDGMGICIKNFENLNLDLREEKLRCFMKTFPVQALIEEVIGFNDPTIYKKENQQLKVLQAALTEYDKREYVTGYEEVPELDASAMSLSEKALAELYIEKIKDELEVKKDQKKCFNCRNIFIQAFHNKIHQNHNPEQVLKVLRMLQEQKIVISWFDNYVSATTKDYIVYF